VACATVVHSSAMVPTVTAIAPYFIFDLYITQPP
jgi:hypothetical protein